MITPFVRRSFSKGPATRQGALRLLTRLAAVCAMVALLCTAATAQLESDPKSIVFERKDTPIEVALHHNGQPLDATAFVDHELFVNGNTYREMLEVTGRPGGVTVRPTALLEIGTYELELETVHGDLRIPLLSPLTAMESSLESRAATLGITVEELKERMGHSVRLERGGIQLNVTPVYFVGQMLHVPLQAEANRLYQWSVNDVPLSDPIPVAELRYVFEAPGDYFFRIQETNLEGASTAQASALVQAAYIPAVRVDTMPNRSLILRGPNEYQVHHWTLDGQPAGSGLEWTHQFSAPGQHVVECVSRGPQSGQLGTFHVQRYTIHVVAP